MTYVEQEFGVSYKSKQSYYKLFADANSSWKKTQKLNPKSDDELVKKSGKKLTKFYLKTRRA
ncbi:MULTISPECIES: winged helix-turn-helix domain-containing protein [unclassified Microcoleus]|uniref:winged helix-turn-helix domain-containing protein n=1 Tax=unclassified Microcoleus TaxID=2642155 RepID=UPI002FCEEFE4